MLTLRSTCLIEIRGDVLLNETAVILLLRYFHQIVIELLMTLALGTCGSAILA